MEALFPRDLFNGWTSKLPSKDEKFYNKKRYHVFKINDESVEAPRSLSQGRRGDAFRIFCLSRI